MEAEATSGVGPEFLTKIARGTVAVGLLVALVFTAAGMCRWGLGVIGGSLWCLANLYGVRVLIVRWVRPGMTRQPPAEWGTALALLLKFPLLYGIGYLMLRSSWFQTEGLMIGFILPFVVTFVDALLQFNAQRRESPAP